VPIRPQDIPSRSCIFASAFINRWERTIDRELIRGFPSQESYPEITITLATEVKSTMKDGKLVPEDPYPAILEHFRKIYEYYEWKVKDDSTPTDSGKSFSVRLTFSPLYPAAATVRSRGLVIEKD
jgi:hypothetical protein